jgi:hypothetical protein
MASPTAMTTRLSSLRIHSKNPLQAAMTERSQHARRPHLTPESPRPGASKTVVDSEERRRLWSIGLWDSACSIDLEAEGGEQNGGSPRAEGRVDWELETRRVLGDRKRWTWVATWRTVLFSLRCCDEEFNNEELQTYSKTIQQKSY